MVKLLMHRVITDRDTGRSKGFGFVTFASAEEASSAIQALDGQDLHGRRVRVNFATDKPHGFGGANGYGSGAGYGGSYGNAPYGGSGRSSNYSNAGAYGGGSYRGGGTYSGSGNNAYGGNVGGSRFGNNSAYDSFQTGRAGPAGSDNFGNIGGGNTNFSSSEGLDSREDDNLGENGGHEVESVDDEDDGADNLAKKA